jgi:hypothetical protein
MPTPERPAISAKPLERFVWLALVGVVLDKIHAAQGIMSLVRDSQIV